MQTAAAKAEEHYLKSPGGSEQAKLNEKIRFNNMMKASEVENTAGKLARIGGKIPVVGLAFSAAGVGMDMATGKPPGKAITSGVVGTAAAFGVEAAAGAAVPAALVETAPLAAAAGPVGLGIVAGVGVGLAADYAWDHWVPDDTKQAINDGIKDFGHGVADTAESAWDSVTSIF